MATLVRTKNLFIAISLVKLNHSHRKYSRKKFYRRIFLKWYMDTYSIFNVNTITKETCLRLVALTKLYNIS